MVTSNLADVLAQAKLMLESVQVIGISVLHTVRAAFGICKSCQHAEVINVVMRHSASTYCCQAH